MKKGILLLSSVICGVFFVFKLISNKKDIAK
ncbi:hypothetical protein SDC9_141636 [bioreactor metagenome]|uniref:Lipoprotein n=2 Tax=root TaxID=1 RepID=A0ABZ3FHB3_9FIRM